MKNIIVVEAASTGMNLIQDIVHRGYNPVVLEVRASDDNKNIQHGRNDSYSHIPYKFDIIQEKDTYEETLEEVRKLDPKVILPGTEVGVVLANKLGADLNLNGNPKSIISIMTRKNEMQEALKKAGIRSILGQVVKSVEEALEFCRKNNLTQVVVKPLESAGSNGVTLCDNLNEMTEAVNSLLTKNDYYGRKIDQCIIQERIIGLEYVVNTVSCKGKHRLTSMYIYQKVKTSEGGYIYNSAELITSLGIGDTSLINYAFDVIDAVGIQYGAVHGEYMIDKNGPVLIEINCRAMGNCMAAEYLDRCLGHHETDEILDAYLDSPSFEIKMNQPYRTYCGAIMKFIIVPANMNVVSAPILEVAKHFQSTYKIATIEEASFPYFATKTVDLETSGGCVYMINEDEYVLHEDFEALCNMEKECFGFILDDGIPHEIKKDTIKVTPKQIIDDVDCYGATLLIADRHYNIENVLSIVPEELDEYISGFDNVIIYFEENIHQTMEPECINTFFKAIEKVKKSGRVIFSEKSYSCVSYGAQGAELLLRVLGLLIEAPLSTQKYNYIIGIKL